MSYHADRLSMIHCAPCGAWIQPTSPTQKWCRDCAEKKQRERKARWMRDKRAGVGQFDDKGNELSERREAW